jgi:hypothetical protein
MKKTYERRRIACERTDGQLVHVDAAPVLYLPCVWRSGGRSVTINALKTGGIVASTRTTAQERHASKEVLPVAGLYVPCMVKGRGRGVSGRAKDWACVAARKRTTAQERQAAEEAPPVFGLYLP